MLNAEGQTTCILRPIKNNNPKFAPDSEARGTQMGRNERDVQRVDGSEVSERSKRILQAEIDLQKAMVFGGSPEKRLLGAVLVRAVLDLIAGNDNEVSSAERHRRVCSFRVSQATNDAFYWFCPRHEPIFPKELEQKPLKMDLKRTRALKELYASLRDDFVREQESIPWSYLWVMSHLGLNPGYFRDGLKRIGILGEIPGSFDATREKRKVAKKLNISRVTKRVLMRLVTIG